jgi:CRISPR-associated endonuclease/helicase Cas3
MDRQMVPLAHSALPARNIGPQEYARHVCAVRREALGRAVQAAAHAPQYGAILTAAVRVAAEFHDLGKLDPENQLTLGTSGLRLPMRHEDAGVAHLLEQAGARFECALAAVLVYSHHKGLPDFPAEEAREHDAFRDCGAIDEN